uniref:Uncharacterized protein n=1 Tax=Trypanosoma vivax (strain Y486) TaxID=1055687 RepID=G0TUY4_TRYVY|nr:hypothetical protein TVY486_0404390 [Trypanosoma vivax Y486]
MPICTQHSETVPLSPFPSSGARRHSFRWYVSFFFFSFSLLLSFSFFCCCFGAYYFIVPFVNPSYAFTLQFCSSLLYSHPPRGHAGTRVLYRKLARPCEKPPPPVPTPFQVKLSRSLSL